MRKLIILPLLFIVSCGFTQIFVPSGGVYGMIREIPDCFEKYARFGDDFKFDNINLKEELESKAYSFFYNDKLHMVSYEPTRPEHLDRLWFYTNEKKERNLHLWCFDNNEWKIVTLNPIQVDYATVNEYQSYFPWRYVSGDTKHKERDGIFSSKLNGHVKKLPNGNIEIKLINFFHDDSSNITFSNKTIQLKPIYEGWFLVIH